MLTIRPTQIEALGKGLQDRFVLRMRDDLTRAMPVEVQRVEDLDAMIRDGIDEAFGHGIDSESGVSAWLRLRVELGPGFEAAPDLASARPALDDPELPAGAKIASLQRAIAARRRAQETGAQP